MRHTTAHFALSTNPLPAQPRDQASRCSMTLAQMMAMAACTHRLSKPTAARRAATQPLQQALSLSADEWSMLLAPVQMPIPRAR